MKLFLARFQAFSDDFFDGALQFQPRVTRGGWVGGGKGWGVGREEAKAPQVKTRGSELLTHALTTRPNGTDSTQLVRSTGANVSVMALQGCKFSPQKSRPLESGDSRHAYMVGFCRPGHI